ncbi:MAG: polysaccharide pyruvyl transferase family protein, partial [Planctomycetales bacterium]|nr:polysaccharide pyruvyl transferase family protein [Planctomycetales bacterium]
RESFRVPVSSHPRIAVCGVRYSANLGDGVISDCLDWMISDVLPGAEVTHHDLAGRTGFGEETISGRREKLRILLALPRTLQNAIVRLLLGRKINRDLLPHWKGRIAGCDGCLIGGGQLLSDADLNFPLKIDGLIRSLDEANLPAAIYACGVTCGGGQGARILARCLSNRQIKAVYLRDHKSMQAVAGFGIHDPVHAYDPAIHVADAYRCNEDREQSDAFDVGINFTDPVNMAYSSGRDLPYVGRLGETLATVVTTLSSRGLKVALFTNGAVEDEQFLDQSDALAGLSKLGNVTRLKRPIEPNELVRSIHRMRSVIAHRLHTNIISFALKIPSIGLEWSQKVPHFFELVGRGEFVVHKDDLTAATILKRFDAMADVPVDSQRLAEMKQDSLSTLRDALTRLGIAVESHG